MIALLAQAVRPTARSIAWSPVVGAALALTVVTLALAGEERAGAVISGPAAALVAFVVVSSVRDRAARLLAAVPTPLLTRRLLRVAIVAPAAIAVLLLAQPEQPLLVLGDAAALALAGLAVRTWVPDGRVVTLGAVVPLAWVGAGQFAGGTPRFAALLWWHTESPIVAAVGLALVVLGSRR